MNGYIHDYTECKERIEESRMRLNVQDTKCEMTKTCKEESMNTEEGGMQGLILFIEYSQRVSVAV